MLRRSGIAGEVEDLGEEGWLQTVQVVGAADLS